MAELIGRVAVQQQEAAGLQGPPDGGEDPRALGGGKELAEDHRDHVEARFRPGPGEEIGGLHRQRDAALGRQRPRLGLGAGGKVERGDVEAASGEIDAVAALAVGDGEGAPSRRQQRPVTDEEIARRRTVDVIRRREASLPMGMTRVRHGAALRCC